MKSILKKIAVLSILSLILVADVDARRGGFGGGRGRGGWGRGGGWGRRGGWGRHWGWPIGAAVIGTGLGYAAGRSYYGDGYYPSTTYVDTTPTVVRVPVESKDTTALERRLENLEEKLSDVLDEIKTQGKTAAAQARLEALQQNIAELQSKLSSAQPAA